MKLKNYMMKIVLQKIYLIKERELSEVESQELFKVKLFKVDELMDLIEDIEFNKNEEIIYKMIHYNVL